MFLNICVWKNVFRNCSFSDSDLIATLCWVVEIDGFVAIWNIASSIVIFYVGWIVFKNLQSTLIHLRVFRVFVVVEISGDGTTAESLGRKFDRNLAELIEI